MSDKIHVYGFSLLELVIVLVIVGILASIGIPSYINTQGRQHDKDAVASLKLILAAERIHRINTGSFYPATDVTVTSIDDINSKLKLSLTEAQWEYTVYSYSPKSFCAKAKRIGQDRFWVVNATSLDSEPVQAGDCP